MKLLILVVFRKILCDQKDLYIRENYSIGFKDLWMNLSLENFRCILLIILITLAFSSNLYMTLLLQKTSAHINYTSRQLILAFVFANLLFLIVNVWIINQQFFPTISENSNAEFFQIDQYDGDLFVCNT